MVRLGRIKIEWLFFAFLVGFILSSLSNVSIVFAASPTVSEITEPILHESHKSNLGEALPLWSALPFACMLLSIAFLPLLAPEFWHKHFGKVSAFWTAIMATPFLIVYRQTAFHEILHILLADYVPFIVLLWSLYTVSGGILLKGTLRGTPLLNTFLLIIGLVLASWMGTTGAAMLLIRPFLKANDFRKNRAFMVVFFIFLVANIGGSLTPLGDPPLFLGFLNGVNFFWTFNILPHMLFVSVTLLVIYFFMDLFFYLKEGPHALRKENEKEALKLEGTHNFLYLAGIIAAVLASGMLEWRAVNILGVHRGLQDWSRDAFLVAMGIFSLMTTPFKIREDNSFTWFPIIEVAYLFVGIFVTMVPCLLILNAGTGGKMAFLISSVTEPVHYFLATGLLSGFLDNAPTYLTFFKTALAYLYPGTPDQPAVDLLMTEGAVFLKAISAGAVFFGALSYIGNAPNFMIRSIAEESGIPMPSFFGYILKYSMIFLLPLYLLTAMMFF